MRKIKNLFDLVGRLIKLNEKSVVIYQMGKVGSSSLEKSLRERGLDVVHIHKLTPVDVYFYDINKMDRFKKVRATILFYITKTLFRVRKCKVITLIRDPMDRNLSQMFHHLDMFIYLRGRFDSRREVAANILFKEIFYNDILLEYAEKWMEMEFKSATNLDYKSVNFDIEKGFAKTKHGNKEIMFVRFEDLNKLEDEIGSFCGLDNFKLVRANSASNKWYGELYKEFRRDFKVDIKEFSRMYDSEFYAKFYGKGLREIKRSIWLNRPTGNSCASNFD